MQLPASEGNVGGWPAREMRKGCESVAVLASPLPRIPFGGQRNGDRSLEGTDLVVSRTSNIELSSPVVHLALACKKNTPSFIPLLRELIHPLK